MEGFLKKKDKKESDEEKLKRLAREAAKEISKEMGVDITTTEGDEDAIALCLKNKYKKK